MHLFVIKLFIFYIYPRDKKPKKKNFQIKSQISKINYNSIDQGKKGFTEISQNFEKFNLFRIQQGEITLIFNNR